MWWGPRGRISHDIFFNFLFLFFPRAGGERREGEKKKRKRKGEWRTDPRVLFPVRQPVTRGPNVRRGPVGDLFSFIYYINYMFFHGGDGGWGCLVRSGVGKACGGVVGGGGPHATHVSPGC